MWRFWKSVVVGTLAGAALPTFVTIPLAIGNIVSPMTGHMDILGSLYLAALPLLISLGLVLASSLIIGLPTATILSFRNAETEKNYQIIGGAAGMFVPLVGLLAIGATAGF